MQFVSTPLAGVPSAGVTNVGDDNVGEVARTKPPVPVLLSMMSSSASCTLVPEYPAFDCEITVAAMEIPVAGRKNDNTSISAFSGGACVKVSVVPLIV